MDDQNTELDPANKPSVGEQADSSHPADSVDSVETTQKSALFSTENFKIKIYNIHHRSAHSQIKQKLISLGLLPKKVKKVDKCDWAYATFSNDEERQKALEAVEGLVWRGKTLTAQKADAAEDPMRHRKRRADETHADGVQEEKIQKRSLEDYRDSLLDKVTPLWRMPYEQQLQLKTEKMCRLLKKLGYDMIHTYKESTLPKSEWPSTEYKALLLPIKPSPVQDGYRNKCEFTIGAHPLTSETTVGFRLGEYKRGTVSVLEPDSCVNVPEAMKRIAESFQEYVRRSKYAPFDPVTQQGNWKWLLVRNTCYKSHIMVMPTFVQQSLPQEELDEMKADVRRYYTEGDGRELGVTSLYIDITPLQLKSSEDKSCPILLWGEETAEEELLGLKFQISPTAFFQVNKAAAEVLYSSVADFAGLSGNTSTLLDVCCGTGTIGMLLAKSARRVIGIELVSEAVDNARQNAHLNGIENIEFECGRAEVVLPNLIKTLPGDEELVAIVDPPRAGLNKEVIQAMRKCISLNKIIYVSCEPQSAMKNFTELMRPTSKRWKGEAFQLVKLLPVDMFPYSDKCELVMLFERTPQTTDVSD